MSHRAVACLAAAALVVSASLRAFGAMPDMPAIFVTDSQETCPEVSSGNIVFGTTASEVHLLVTLPHTDKARATVTWTDPDGLVFAKRVKLGFRSQSFDGIEVRDYIHPYAKEGWWKVEAETEGEYLSTDFLMSDNRQVWTVYQGDIDSKLAVLARVDISTATGRDIVRVATFDRSYRVRAAAARMLAGIGEDWAAGRTRVLLYDTSAQVRLAVVGSIESLGEPERESAYLYALGSESAEVRLYAVRGLAELGTGPAEEGLVNSLSDKDPRIRTESLAALIGMGSELYRTYLPELVVDQERKVAEPAVEMAARLDEGDLRVRSLVAGASGAFDDLRRKAVESLEGTRDERAVPVFMARFRKGLDRRAMLEALSLIDGPSVVAALDEIYTLSERDEYTRFRAVKYLGGRGPVMSGTVEKALGDGSGRVRVAAVESAATIEDPDARGRLLALAFNVRDLSVRKRALSLLAANTDPRTTPFIIDALSDEDLRGDALGYAVRDRSEASLSLLADRAAGIPDAGFRSRAVGALVDAGAGVKQLMPFARDESAGVLFQTIRGLSAIEGADAVRALIIAGSSKETEVRSAAANAMAGRPAGDLRAAVDMTFEAGVTDPLAFSFMTGTIKDEGVLRHIVDSIRAGDCNSLSAAVLPMVSRGGPSDAGPLIDAFGRCGSSLDDRIIRALAGMESDPEGVLLAEAFSKSPGNGAVILDAAGGKAGPALKAALESPSAELRRKAVGMLEREDMALPKEDALRKAAGDPDREVRDRAMTVAAGLGIDNVVLEASRDDEPGVRASSLVGLARMGTFAAYAQMASLARDEDQAVRDGALDALSVSGESVPPEVWESVLMEGDTDEPFLTVAVRALSDRPGPESAKALAYAFGEYGPAVSGEAAKGLVSIGPESLEYMHPMLEDGGLWRRALEVVVGVSDPSSVKPVVGLMERLDEKDRVEPVAALGVLGGDEAVDALVREFGQGGPYARVAVLKALAAAGPDGDDPRVLAVIRDSLDSADDSVRFYGAHAAAELGASGVEARLRELAVNDPSKLVRRQAAAAISSIGRTSAAP